MACWLWCSSKQAILFFYFIACAVDLSLVLPNNSLLFMIYGLTCSLLPDEYHGVLSEGPGGGLQFKVKVPSQSGELDLNRLPIIPHRFISPWPFCSGFAVENCWMKNWNGCYKNDGMAMRKLSPSWSSPSDSLNCDKKSSNPNSCNQNNIVM